MTINPFDKFPKLDVNQDRRRKAKALNEDELLRLIEAAKNRPLEDAMTVRRGPNQGQKTIKLSDQRIRELTQLGQERALIYKTAILTGLRMNELRTLQVMDISFGDVPFVRLQAAKEKNRQGSSVPLRRDLAYELSQWTKGKERTNLVFNVPAGILKIMNRDLLAAKIDKQDADGSVIHFHALRHSLGTHLSRAGVAPRTAQALMRHSNINLTMNTYTDSRLLDKASAIESIDILRPELAPTLAPLLAPPPVQSCPNGSNPVHSEGPQASTPKTQKPCNSLENAGFSEVGGRELESPTSTMSTLDSTNSFSTNSRKNEDQQQRLHQILHLIQTLDNNSLMIVILGVLRHLDIPHAFSELSRLYKPTEKQPMD